jgi:NAD(P)-dependent dehydrogenase (short-subunit alcohol dehydrogenase family)
LKLDGKVAIVTGSATGIGRSIAVLFAENGAKVVVATDLNTKGGEETVRLIKNTKGDAIFVRADISKTLDVQNLIRKTVEEYGRLNILCNNAGINPTGTVVDTSEELFDRVININLKGVFLGMKYAIPEMLKARGGSIVNIASVNGLVGNRNEAAYDASKGGVVLLTQATALDFGSKNIRVNAICPGVVETPLLHKYITDFPQPEKFLAELSAMNAGFKRLLRPKEIASMALFLASDDSSGVTGAAYVVDGGYTAI